MADKLIEKCRLTDGELRTAYKTWRGDEFVEVWDKCLQNKVLAKGIPLIQAENRELLKKAVALIKIWHNGEAVMKLGQEQAEYLWNIYYNNAPEMKEIREALSEGGKHESLSSEDEEKPQEGEAEG